LHNQDQEMVSSQYLDLSHFIVTMNQRKDLSQWQSGLQQFIVQNQESVNTPFQAYSSELLSQISQSQIAFYDVSDIVIHRDLIHDNYLDELIHFVEIHLPVTKLLDEEGVIHYRVERNLLSRASVLSFGSRWKRLPDSSIREMRNNANLEFLNSRLDPVTATIRFHAQACKHAVRNVDIVVDGEFQEVVKIYDQMAMYQFDIRDVAEGIHTIEFVQYDEFGNSVPLDNGEHCSIQLEQLQLIPHS
jgi:hypothetical protein